MVTINALLMSTVLLGAGDTLLLDFYSDRCGPCIAMQPIVDRLERANYPVQRINVDRDPQTAARFGVDQIPAFVLIVDGKVRDKIVGPASFDRLVRMFPNAHAELVTPTRPSGRVAVRGQSPDDLSTDGPTSGEPTSVVGSAISQLSSHFNGSGRSTTPARAEQATLGHSSETARQRALAATVRLRVEDASGVSHGTGTIIDTHGEEALVITCGHLFRDSAGKGRITVDLFSSQGTETVAGTLIDFDADQRDIGLVAIRPGRPVTPAAVATSQYPLSVGDELFSIGCDQGAAPSIRDSRLTAIDRYLGAPNLEAAGQPVDGRSGGGLFDARGVLVGVCNAADPQEGKGIYAAFRTVHWQLDQIGLQRVYQNQVEVAASLARGEEPPVAQDDLPALPDQMPRDRSPQREILGADSGENFELILIRRSANGQQKEVRLISPSPELVSRLQNELGQQPRREIASLPQDSRATWESEARGPIVRGQQR